MIKGIEVGGVMYGITLADDMVGKGLKKDENGAVTLRLGTSGSNSEVPVAMSTNETLVLKYGTGLQQRNGVLSLRYGTGLTIGNNGEIYVDSGSGGSSGNSRVIVDDDYALLIGSNSLQIGTSTDLGSQGLFNIRWEEGMRGIELRISSEEVGVYLEDGSKVLGGLTLSSEIRGLHVTHTASEVKDESGFLNIILREGSDILFSVKDYSGNTYRGSVALTKV